MASSSSVVFPKKKRNQPGNPDPDVEVIALSPRTLIATNLFICEVSQKGFQREQNLQLHRRAHNLPWKLKQKATNVARRKVYLCPEITCVHHDPSRALGDLTGNKKHFLRKNGEQKYECGKCSKKYAVLSDWKAHSKTCGTREYRCNCGTLFSRRDSFIKHHAFCDDLALAQETTRNSISLSGAGCSLLSSACNGSIVSYPQIRFLDTTSLLGLGQSAFPPSHPTLSPYHPSMPMVPSSSSFFLPETLNVAPMHSHSLLHNHSSGSGSSSSGMWQYNLGYFSNRTNSGGGGDENLSTMLFESHFNNGSNNGSSYGALSSTVPSLFTPSPLHQLAATRHMSATALLQKAAQMGSTSKTTSSSVLRTFSGEHRYQFGGGMYDLVASITTPPGNYSSDGAANISFECLESPLKLHRSSDKEHGRLGSSQEGLTRDFLGILLAGSSGGETAVDKKPPPPKEPAFGVGGILFK